MSEKKSPGDIVSDQASAPPQEKISSSQINPVVIVAEATSLESTVEEVKPLSAIEAYRLERKREFEARVKKIKETEAINEAVKKKSLQLDQEDDPATLSLEEQLPTVSENSVETELFGRPGDGVMFTPPPERSWEKTALSAFIFVGLPVLIAIIYYGLIASNQYASVAQFSIHSNSPPSSGSSSAPSGLASMLSGGASPDIGEMFVVQEYIESPQMLIDIQSDVNLREIFGRSQIDYWARLRGKQVSDDALLKYWQSMVQVQVDNTTSLGQLSVRAFTPGDAKTIADSVLDLSEKLVNKISDRSQQDTINLAQKEVDSAYARVLKAHRALMDFVSQPAAPTDNATDRLSTRDRLNLELNFAEQAYASSLTTLESARLVATGKGLYLEAFVKPQLADYPEYPKRTENVLFTLLLFGLPWILGVLVVAATKEHL